jgi:hypothetical protein
MTVGDLETDFDQLLRDAELNANPEWEADFVAGLRRQYERWGDRMYISERQLEVLRGMADQ